MRRWCEEGKGREGRDEGECHASQWVRTHVMEFGIDHTSGCGLREFTFWTYSNDQAGIFGYVPNAVAGRPAIYWSSSTNVKILLWCTATEDSSQLVTSAAKIRSASDCFLEGLPNDEITS